MVVNELYGAKDGDVSAGFDFSGETLRKALLNIYSKDFHPASDIETNLFNDVFDALGKAVDEGAAAATDSDKEFINALRHSAAVFSAFKVHRAQNDMARLLIDADGNLKPFEQWRKEVMPIANHQCRTWLRTEYDTAVLRAHQAADWQQFIRERDVLPNLKWMPSTSLHPGADHRPFWNTIRPVDDPFWSKHRPGDRWNCKCDLTATDEDPTPLPDDDRKSNPQPGLDNNPGTDGIIFSDSHPYFPNDCKHCAFYKPGFKDWMKHVFRNRAKDCYDCPYIKECLERVERNGFKLEKSFHNGGRLYVHPKVDRDKPDYKDVKRVCLHLARMGHQVRMTPRLHYLSDEYQRVYKSLTNTKYYRKCPDFEVDGLFYEFEGFTGPWNKRKVKSMISHGLEQSSRIVVKNTKGCSDRFIRKAVMARRNLPNQNIDEVWIYEKGEIRLFYKDGKFHR